MDIQQFKRPWLNENVINWLDVNLSNYLNKLDQNERHTKLKVDEVDHIVDFLSSQEAPSKMHLMSVEEALSKSKDWLKLQTKKGYKIVETEEDVEVVLKLKGGMKLVKLLSKEAYEREGSLMSHCVASYFGRKGVDVYSLRDINNNPHCTFDITISNDIINSIKGKGNGSIHPKYISYMIEILQYFNINVNERELENLGYTMLSEDMWKFLDNFEGSKYVSFGGKKFFYKYSNLKKMEEKNKEILYAKTI